MPVGMKSRRAMGRSRADVSKAITVTQDHHVRPITEFEKTPATDLISSVRRRCRSRDRSRLQATPREDSRRRSEFQEDLQVEYWLRTIRSPRSRAQRIYSMPVRSMNEARIRPKVATKYPRALMISALGPANSERYGCSPIPPVHTDEDLLPTRYSSEEARQRSENRRDPHPQFEGSRSTPRAPAPTEKCPRAAVEARRTLRAGKFDGTSRSWAEEASIPPHRPRKPRGRLLGLKRSEGPCPRLLRTFAQPVPTVTTAGIAASPPRASDRLLTAVPSPLIEAVPDFDASSVFIGDQPSSSGCRLAW